MTTVANALRSAMIPVMGEKEDIDALHRTMERQKRRARELREKYGPYPGAKDAQPEKRKLSGLGFWGWLLLILAGLYMLGRVLPERS